MNKKEPKYSTHHLPISMSICLSVGMAIGAAAGNISVGMCIGLCVGLCIGTLLDARARKNTQNDDGKNQDEMAE